MSARAPRSRGEGLRRARLIAAREFHERVGQRAYRLALIFGALLAAFAVLLPTIVGGDDDASPSAETVLVAITPAVGGGDVSIDELRQAAAGVRGGTIRLKVAADADAVRKAVRDGDEPLGLLVGGTGVKPTVTVVSRQDGGGELADQAALLVDRSAAIARLANTGADSRDVLAPAALKAEVVSGSGPTDRSAAVVGVLGLLLYIGGLMLATAYATGVVTDRTNHVTERLLTAARPFEHLSGKMAGVGAAGLLQFAAWLAAALIASAASGSGNAFDGVPARLLIFFPVALIITYLLYASVAAVMVLPVRKSEDVGAAIAPATILQIVGFSAATAIIAPGSTVSPTIHALSLIPFFSPLLMLARLAGEAVPAGELAIGILGPLVLSAILLRLVAPAYARYAIEAPGGKGIKAAVALLRR
jgi:ABC-2 type transport system permease protein